MRPLLFLAVLAPCLFSQEAIPKTIGESVGNTMQFAEGRFLSIAEAMPEPKYSFIPAAGNFEGSRSFAEQVKHVACVQFGYFNEIEGKTPPDLSRREALPRLPPRPS